MDPASAFLSAVQAGASISAENSRLNQAAQAQSLQVQMEQRRIDAAHAAEQDRIQRETAMQSQRLAQQAAFQQATIGIRKQQLDQAAQKAQAVATISAQKFAAQQEYQRRVSAGEDPATVALQLGPSMSGGSIGGLAGLARIKEKREQGPFIPSTLKMPTGDGRTVTMMQLSPNRYSVVPDISASERSRLSANASERRQILEKYKNYGGPDSEMSRTRFGDTAKADSERVQAINEEINAITSKGAPQSAPEADQESQAPSKQQTYNGQPVFTPSSKSEYDKLAAGSYYIDPSDGKMHRKKK